MKQKTFPHLKTTRVDGDRLSRSQVIVAKYPQPWPWFLKSGLFEKAISGTCNQQNGIKCKTYA